MVYNRKCELKRLQTLKVQDSYIRPSSIRGSCT